MNTLAELQRWYHAQCNGHWEHSWGIKIGTLDNPGWSIEINLHETVLAGKSFQEHSYGVGQNSESSGDEWIVCKVEKNVFKGFGGPFKLQEMIEVFLDWSKKEQLT